MKLKRIALGDFKELNIILKGDVDDQEALTDSFQKLSTEEIQVNIIHKGVGAITESDVLLASPLMRLSSDLMFVLWAQPDNWQTKRKSMCEVILLFTTPST